MTIIKEKISISEKMTLNQKKKENFFVYSLYSALIVLVITLFTTAYNNNNQSHAEEGVITVYKSATCGCCKNWISHLQSSPLVKEMGFKIKAVNRSNMSLIKDIKGVPSDVRSCHTAVINDYVIEGHVPAEDIIKLLKQQRDVVGLAVPGMPMGSPGMEGNRVDKYSVYEFDQQGKSTVVNQY